MGIAFTILIIILLIICSALFSGLTLGLMGLDVYEVERKAKFGNKNAQKVYPLRKKGNLLLTVLLLGNVAVNAALSVYLTEIASGVVAGIVATALIFIFGEIFLRLSFRVMRYVLVRLRHPLSRYLYSFFIQSANLLRGF